MNKTVLIHNPNCSKSREAKNILDDLGVQFLVIDYLKEGFKDKLLHHLPGLLGLSFSEMIRKNEDVYKELGLADKKLSEDEWIEIIKERPILLERPIFIHQGKGIIARPPELVKTLL